MSQLWYPFTPMQSWASEERLHIVEGQGNYLIDNEGKRYLDGVSSLWTNVHGHNHPRLNAAIQRQLGKIAHSTLLGLGSPIAEELAAKLVELTPEGLNHVFYSDSGSTSVEIALKQAFQYYQLIGQPEKREFIHIAEAYHGDTLGAVAVGGISLFHQVYGPLLNQSNQIPSPHGFRHPQGQAGAMAESLSALDTLLEERAHKIAALIIEPLVQGAGGLLVHPEGYLKAVAKRCQAHNVLLIVDEVATGFGRTGKMFACEHEGVEPDLMCLAKGITGGYLPLAATLSTSKIFDAFLAPRHEGKTFFHGHTYTGNALACAVALENLAIFEDEDLIAQLPAKVSALASELQPLHEHPQVGQVRQRGLMVGIELVADKAGMRAYPSEQALGHRICLQARKYGVVVRNLGDVIVLMPPLSVQAKEIVLLVDAVQKAINAITLAPPHLDPRERKPATQAR